VGLNFADVTEAENFFAVVEEKISQRNNRFGIKNKYVLAQYFVSNVFYQFNINIHRVIKTIY